MWYRNFVLPKWKFSLSHTHTHSTPIYSRYMDIFQLQDPFHIYNTMCGPYKSISITANPSAQRQSLEIEPTVSHKHVPQVFHDEKAREILYSLFLSITPRSVKKSGSAKVTLSLRNSVVCMSWISRGKMQCSVKIKQNKTKNKSGHSELLLNVLFDLRTSFYSLSFPKNTGYKSQWVHCIHEYSSLFCWNLPYELHPHTNS